MFDIADVLKEFGIAYKPVVGQTEYVMACPICDRMGHFYYNYKKNLCLCQRCKWEGNHLGFLVAGLGLTKSDAVRRIFGVRDTSVSGIRARIHRLLDSMGKTESIETYQVYFKNPLPPNAIPVRKGVNWPASLTDRQISQDEVARYRIKLCTEGRFAQRLIIPVSTLKTRTFMAPTALRKSAAAIMKDLHAKRGINFRKNMFPIGSEMSEVLYLYNRYMKSKKWLAIVEGPWDAYKVIRAGWNAVATLGDKVSRRQALLLSETRAKGIILMLDGSVPKERVNKYRTLLDEVCIDKNIGVCKLPGDKDPDDMSLGRLDEILKKARRRARWRR